MSYTTIETELKNGVAYVWLNRPDLRNAMNDVVIGELTGAVAGAIADDAARVIVLGGRGKAFCAGADLAWMKKGREMSPEERARTPAASPASCACSTRAPSRRSRGCTARRSPAAWDWSAPATSRSRAEAQFCLSEVKLGLMPAMISPYVIRAMGERAARRYFLSAEVFDAAEAHRIGLVHESSSPRNSTHGSTRCWATWCRAARTRSARRSA